MISVSKHSFFENVGHMHINKIYDFYYTFQKQRLKMLGARNYKELIKRGMEKLCTDEFMSMYSYVGHKKKKPLKGLKIAQALIGKLSKVHTYFQLFLKVLNSTYLMIN